MSDAKSRSVAPGICALIFGGISVFFLGIVFGSLGLLFSLWAFYNYQTISGLLGLGLSLFGLYTSVMFWGAMA